MSFHRSLLFTAAAVLLCTMPVAHAQDWAKANLAKSPRHGEFVTIPEAGGRKLQAWVVYPEVKDKAPVVMMIHEIFGLSDWAKEMADELAGAGYIVVAPDLLSGFGPAATASELRVPARSCDPMNCGQGQNASRSWHTDAALAEMARVQKQSQQSAPHLVLTAYDSAKAQQQQPAMDHSHMQMGGNGAGAAFVPANPGGTSAFLDQGAITRAVSSLDPTLVTKDLDAAADYGKKLPAASGKLYVAGFCWGGGKTFLFATHRADLSGAFVFYGPPPPADAMKSISAPVYGFYAGNDARITATVPQTQTDMKAAGKMYEPVTYDGAGHGFMRAGEAPDASAENSAARQAGFQRFVKLLGGVR